MGTLCEHVGTARWDGHMDMVRGLRTSCQHVGSTLGWLLEHQGCPGISVASLHFLVLILERDSYNRSMIYITFNFDNISYIIYHKSYIPSLFSIGCKYINIFMRLYFIASKCLLLMNY